jgi:hypothetical protein
MTYYVAEFNDQEYFFEINDKIFNTVERECSKFIDSLGIRTDRNNPESVNVKVYTQTIVNGKICKKFVKTYKIMPPLKQMSEKEYVDELNSILSSIDVSFRGYVSSEAWNRGHFSGYEEVLNIARDIVHDLKPCIESHVKSIRGF